MARRSTGCGSPTRPATPPTTSACSTSPAGHSSATSPAFDSIPGEPVFAPTPPPDIDIDQWLASVALVADWRPTRLGITHYGVVEDPEPHLAAIADDLRREAELIRSGIEADDYVR